jgi:putative Holliday junction resolvase
MGRVAGLDYGDRRIGIALSDPDRIIASAHAVVTYKNIHEALREVARVCRDAQADQVVIGLPLNMDGTHGPAVEKVRIFAAKLAGLVPIPIVMWDERLTTKSAHNVLIEAGTRRAARKNLVDKVAAQIMLQHYLDSHPAP